jgi:hypothetical protein
MSDLTFKTFMVEGRSKNKVLVEEEIWKSTHSTQHPQQQKHRKSVVVYLRVACMPVSLLSVHI